MPVTDGPLDPKVGEALCDDQNVVSVMQHPKMAEALGLLKKDPSQYYSLVKDDPELEALFGKLRVMMEDKEAAMPAAPAPAGPPPLPLAPKKNPVSAAVADVLGGDDVPSLAGSEEVEAEATKAEGTAAFESGDYAKAAECYEKAASLQPSQPIHWSNLAVARLRGGRPEAAVEAATEATRLNPRFAKGWLRLGEALMALGDAAGAVSAYESGLQRAEGAIRLALTKALQKAKPQAAAASSKPGGGGGGGARPDASSKSSSLEGATREQEAATKKEARPLPTLEEERLRSAEMDALRRQTDERMKQYAAMAKQQTQAAAKPEVKPEAKKAEPAKEANAGGGMRKVMVIEDEDEEEEDDDERIVDITPAQEPVQLAAAPAPKPSGIKAPEGMKKMVIEDDDDDDDDEDEEEKASGGRMTPGAEGLFGAALEKWSEEKVVKPEPAEVEAKKAAPKAAKKPMPMPFSNDLVFDLA